MYNLDDYEISESNFKSINAMNIIFFLTKIKNKKNIKLLFNAKIL